ncbi:hypothetical protein BH23BAC1_BH23BAC1_38840 [soil metagenome]
MSLNDLTIKNSPHPIVTISFFKYKGIKKFWGFAQMQLAKKPISETPGLTFFRLMGSGGGNGFSLKPDFSVYALITVWKNKNYARNFHKTSKVFRDFKKHSHKWWTLYLTTLKSKGKWDRVNPFFPVSGSSQEDIFPIAVLTRATISPRHLVNFWKHVPAVSEMVQDQEGIIYSKGIGEYPLFLQATFSIWENKAAMRNYAYQSELHKDIIGKTHKFGWYKEELFSEFKILESEGTWNISNIVNLRLTAEYQNFERYLNESLTQKKRI